MARRESGRTKLSESEKRRKGRRGGRGGDEWKGIIPPCAAAAGRRAGPFCAGAGLRSAPAAAQPLCFTFGTIIAARIVERGELC